MRCRPLECDVRSRERNTKPPDPNQKATKAVTYQIVGAQAMSHAHVAHVQKSVASCIGITPLKTSLSVSSLDLPGILISSLRGDDRQSRSKPGALDVVPDVQRLAVGQVVEVQWAGAIF